MKRSWSSGIAIPGTVGSPFRPSRAPSLSGLLVVAIQHEQLWRTEKARRRRLGGVEEVLVAVAATFGVRDVFGRVHELSRKVLPHGVLLLATRGEDGRTARIDALAGREIPEALRSLQLKEDELALRPIGHEIVTPVDTSFTTTALRGAVRSPRGAP